MLISVCAVSPQATDNARWWLHKLFLVAPQFALGDGMLDIAKNTIRAQVSAI